MLHYAYTGKDSKRDGMQQIKDRCIRMGVEVPQEVDEYLASCINLPGSRGLPYPPHKCGKRVPSTGIEDVGLKLDTNWSTTGKIITLSEVDPQCSHILLVDGDWNERGFVK